MSYLDTYQSSQFQTYQTTYEVDATRKTEPIDTFDNLFNEAATVQEPTTVLDPVTSPDDGGGSIDPIEPSDPIEVDTTFNPDDPAFTLPDPRELDPVTGERVSPEKSLCEVAIEQVSQGGGGSSGGGGGGSGGGGGGGGGSTPILIEEPFEAPLDPILEQTIINQEIVDSGGGGGGESTTVFAPGPSEGSGDGGSGSGTTTQEGGTVKKEGDKIVLRNRRNRKIAFGALAIGAGILGASMFFRG